MTLADMRFAHAVARIRVLEQRLLDRGRLERLLEAADAGEVLHLLAETEYGAAAAAVKGGQDYEHALAAELQRVYALVKSFSPEPRLLEAWAARHTFHNLKAVLKAALRGEAAEEGTLSPLGAMDRGRLEAVAAEAVGEGAARPGQAAAPVAVSLPTVPAGPPQVRVGGTVGERVAGPEVEGYVTRAAKTAVAAYRSFGGPEEIDQAVDRAYQEYLLALARVPGAEFLRGWVERWTDLANLRTFLRFALAGRDAGTLLRALLPGGAVPVERLVEAYESAPAPRARLEALQVLAARTPYGGLVSEGISRFEAEGLLHGFERLMDLYLLDYLRRAKRETFGLAPVWAYLMAKEQEVRLLRLILVGKSAGLSPERLRERMSDVYA
ncbi:MAG: V-type ATPase subunit [Bacillota bacterium]|nr:V-type ATPase subunit [Bacillota bacterium]